MTEQALPYGVALDVIVVDNASGDGSIERIRAVHPAATVIALPENRYYAGGLAAGASRALVDGAEWLLVLNNDTVAAPDLVARLLEAAQRDDRSAVACPTIYLHRQPGVVWPSAGRRRALTLAGIDTTAAARPGDAPYEVDWCTGCCMLVRAEAWRALGGFDAAAFPFYYDDHDFCLRAQAAGWKLLHVPSARLWHKVAQSAGLGSARQGYLYGRGSARFFLRHARGWRRALILPYRAGSLLMTAGRSLARGRLGYLAAYVRGLIDGLRAEP